MSRREIPTAERCQLCTYPRRVGKVTLDGIEYISPICNQRHKDSRITDGMRKQLKLYESALREWSSRYCEDRGCEDSGSSVLSWKSQNPLISWSEFWKIYHEIADVVFKARSPVAPLYSSEEVDEHVKLQEVLRTSLGSFVERMQRGLHKTPIKDRCEIEDFMLHLEREMKR